MALWGLIVAISVAVGPLPLLIGLAVIIPISGPRHLASLPRARGVKKSGRTSWRSSILTGPVMDP
jgi:hypothetical protein